MGSRISGAFALGFAIWGLATWGLAGAALAEDCGVNGVSENGVVFPACPPAVAAPAPSYHVWKVSPAKANPEGGFTRTVILDIDAPYVPGNVLIWALGPSLMDLKAASEEPLNYAAGTLPQGARWLLISRPWGRYTVSILSKDPNAPIQLHLDFNHHNPPPR
ncbi:MAG: hypothetical protein KGL69_11860 [Alphaproteobacteria bacterium]|nr:hypothetical protein [Alphaproteobacteria bacterium]